MLLNSIIQDLRVSTVLNDDQKSYGEQFLLDGREDTCWNSECGLPQSIFFSLAEPARIDKIRIMFQGGFVGTVCEMYCNNEQVCTFYPKDVNDMQEFALSSALQVDKTSLVELRFSMSSDFYGRVTVYMIEIVGDVCK